MWQVGSRIALTKASEVGQRNWGCEKNETPAADLRASAGSLHIIKARGCFQWLHLRPSPHRLHQTPHADLSSLPFWMSFPARRDGSWWDLPMYVRKFILGGGTCNSFAAKERLSLPFHVSNHTAPPIHGRTAEAVMDAHCYIVSKYTPVSLGALFCDCSI